MIKFTCGLYEAAKELLRLRSYGLVEQRVSGKDARRFRRCERPGPGCAGNIFSGFQKASSITKVAMRQALHFIRYLMRSFVRDRCLQNAGVLSYASVLSLIPLMTVAFALLSAFPRFHELIVEIQDFIFTNFLPATGDTVLSYLQTFARQAQDLTMAGLIFLVLTALFMMHTIDQAFDAIWKTHRRRKQIAGFLAYWAVLTLGPLLIGLGLIVSSYLASLPLLGSLTPTQAEKARLIEVVPFTLEFLAFTLVYAVMPRRAVPMRHALAGGLLAAVFFEAAKKGFALYITHIAAYKVVYGILAAVPIFLVWIYLSWVIALLGAEFARCLASFRGGAAELPIAQCGFILSYRVIGHLWRAQQAGNPMSVKKLLDCEPCIHEANLHEVLGTLEAARIVHLTEHGDWALSRDLDRMTLRDIHRASAYPIPDPGVGWEREDAWNQALQQVLLNVNKSLDASLDVPLKSMYEAQYGPDELHG